MIRGPTPELLRVLTEGPIRDRGHSLGVLGRMYLAPPWSRRRFAFVMTRAGGEAMRRLSVLVQRGALTAVVNSILLLPRLADLHQRLDAGHARRKIVITIPWEGCIGCS